MLKNFIGYVIAVSCFSAVLVSTAHAEQAPVSPQVPEAVAKTIVDGLKSARPDLNFGAVEKTPINGLYLVRIDGTQFLYASETGEYIIDGDMYRARPGMFVPIKDLAAAKIRKDVLAGIAKDDTIVFPAADKPKSVLYVFTDVDCYYCQKLHMESVPELNKSGVEVRYLAYPRAGLNSESYRKIASAWCAKDKPQAMTDLKQRKPIPENVCDPNPVADQFALGQKVGVTGTPALVLEDGTLLPGYRPAPELLKIIGIN